MLTFVITALAMTALFFADAARKQAEEARRTAKENADLKRKIANSEAVEQRRRESSAYDRGLYDGRTTDAYYRQCLKKFTGREQADVMLNGTDEEA